MCMDAIMINKDNNKGKCIIFLIYSHNERTNETPLLNIFMLGIMLSIGKAWKADMTPQASIQVNVWLFSHTDGMFFIERAWKNPVGIKCNIFSWCSVKKTFLLLAKHFPL